MSTNYYATLATGEELHIGKQSHGWKFLWRAHPEHDIWDLQDWLKALGEEGAGVGSEKTIVRNEYDDRMTFSEFTARIDFSTNARGHYPEMPGAWRSGGLWFYPGEFS